jgi:hypothetical protein
VSGQCAASQCTNTASFRTPDPVPTKLVAKHHYVSAVEEPSRQAQSALFTFRTRLDLWLFKLIGVQPPPPSRKASGCPAVCLMTPSQLQSNGYRPDCDSIPGRQEHHTLRMSGTSPERPAYTSDQCTARFIAQALFENFRTMRELQSNC